MDHFMKLWVLLLSNYQEMGHIQECSENKVFMGLTWHYYDRVVSYIPDSVI